MAKPPASLRFSVWWPQGLCHCAHPRSPAPRPWVTSGLSTAICGGPACSSLVGCFRGVKGAGTMAWTRWTRYPGWGWVGLGRRTRPSQAGFAASSQAPLQSAPNGLRSAPLPPLCCSASGRPCGGTVVGSRPLGPRPEREVSGPQELTARLRLRPRAERCREAQFCWLSFYSCRKIMPRPDLWALGPAGRASTASFRVGDGCEETRFLPGCGLFRTSGVCAKPPVLRSLSLLLGPKSAAP